MTAIEVHGKRLLIRPTEESDITTYIKVCQIAAEEAYSNEKLAIDRNLFSLDAFFKCGAFEYWQKTFMQTSCNRSYIALLDKTVVGGISGHKYVRHFELNSFYVLPKFQGYGIGKALWQHMISWMDGMPIELEVFSHATKTVAMYEKWGFVYMGFNHDRCIHWPTWPPGKVLRAKRYCKND